MSMFQAADSLREILCHPTERLEGLKKWDDHEARQLFLKLHLPLLVLFPLASLSAPLVHILDSFSARHAIYPPVAILAALTYATIFDRISGYFRKPRMEEKSYATYRNTSLYLHLPLSGSALFFFIHPIIGYIMLFFSWIYVTWLSWEATARLERMSRIKVFVHWLCGIPLFAIPLLLLLFLANIYRSMQIFEQLR